MTAGAMESERAQGDFMAATGRSREEAIAFTKDMNAIVGTAKTVGYSFEEITAAGIAVAQQFGVTGEKGRALTEDILGFAKVTGQDAKEAAFQLEDTLSAMGLGAEDAAGFMDKLVASNQKYGTDAGPATLAVLQGMAPALQAMGEDLDSGIGLLNLFETAGLDAGAAQRALQTAVQELKPGQSLDDLIAQIGAVEDPAARAQAAIEIFGTKAGVGLANAIQPGMTSLDDFEIDAEEAAGAADKAAEDMLTTTDKFRMFADKVGGIFRDAGQTFGPLITAAASVGSLIAPALAGSWDKVKDSPLVKRAIERASMTTGPIYTGAMKVGDAIGTALSSAWDATKGVGRRAIEAAAAAAAFAYKSALKLAELVADAAGAAWDGLKAVTGTVLTKAGESGGIAGGVYRAAAWAVDAFVNTAKTAWEVISSVVSSVVKAAAEAGGIAGAAYRLTAAAYDKLAAALTGAWLAAGGSPQVAGSAKAAGMSAGKWFATGLAVGLPALLIDPLTQAFDDLLKAGPGNLSREGLANIGKTNAELVRKAAEQEFAENPVSVVFGPPEPPPPPGEDWHARHRDTAGQIAVVWEDSAIRVHQAYAHMRERIVEEAAKTGPEAAAALEAKRQAILDTAWGIGNDTPGAFSRGARDNFSSVQQAFKDLRELMKNTLDPAKQEAELVGILTHQRLAKGLKDGRPVVRAESQQIVLNAIAELAKLNPQSEAIGESAIQLLASATAAEKPALRLALQGILGLTATELDKLLGIASSAGTRSADSLSAAFKRQVDFGPGLAKLRRQLEILSPAKEGPWSKDGGPTAWAERAGDKIGGGLSERFYRALDLGPGLERIRGALDGPWLPSLAGSLGDIGFSHDVVARSSSTNTVRHEGTVLVRHELTPETLRAARDAGYDERKLADAFAWNLEHAFAVVDTG